MKFCLSLLLLTLSCLVSGQNRVSFCEVPLGSDYKTFVKALKHQGFKTYLERDSEDDYFFGVCREGFFTGKIDGVPAVVHLMASHGSKSVFSVKAILREFIDQEEAVEESDRLFPQIRDQYPYHKMEILGNSASLVEMPSGDKRITKYLCLPAIVLMMRYYDSEAKLNDGESFGSVSMSIYLKTLNKEYILVLDYYDKTAAKLAEQEAGKK